MAHLMDNRLRTMEKMDDGRAWLPNRHSGELVVMIDDSFSAPLLDHVTIVPR